MPFFSEKCPFAWEKKGLLRGVKIFGLFFLKSALFKVEKCPFSQKSALLFERKKAFYGEEKNWPFFAEKCSFQSWKVPFLSDKCPFVWEKIRPFTGIKKKTGFFSLKSALFKVEKCPFSQKSALLLERKKAFYGE